MNKLHVLATLCNSVYILRWLVSLCYTQENELRCGHMLSLMSLRSSYRYFNAISLSILNSTPIRVSYNASLNYLKFVFLEKSQHIFLWCWINLPHPAIVFRFVCGQIVGFRSCCLQPKFIFWLYKV